MSRMLVDRFVLLALLAGKQVVQFMIPAFRACELKSYDLDKIDAILDGASKSASTVNLDYCLAAILKNRGRTDRARRSFIRCAQSSRYQSWNHVLA